MKIKNKYKPQYEMHEENPYAKYLSKRNHQFKLFKCIRKKKNKRG